MKNDMQNDIYSFFIYESRVYEIEMSEPIIYFSYTKKEQNMNFAMNQAGLFVTYVAFCKVFNKNQPCDYVQTNKYETELLELWDNIWMSITRKFKNISHHLFLKSILQYYKRVFHLFFPKLVRNQKNGDLTPESCKNIKIAFDFLLNSAYNPNMIIPILFNSAKIVVLPFGNFSASFENTIKAILNTPGSPLQYLAIMYDDHYLFSNFPPDVFQTLALSIVFKFGYLKLLSSEKDKNDLFFEIGLRKLKNDDIKVYSPEIYINGKNHHLSVLKIGSTESFRFIIALKESISPTVDVLNSLPIFIRPLHYFLDSLHIGPRKIKNKIPYLQIYNNHNKKCLYYSTKKISTQFLPSAHQLIINGILFTHSTQINLLSNYVSIFIPSSSRFFMLCKSDQISESVVVIKTESKKISKIIEDCKSFNNPMNTNCLCVQNISNNSNLMLPIVPF